MKEVRENYNIWQIGSGTRGRDYSSTFMEHSVALIGPGYSGEWRSDGSNDSFTNKSDANCVRTMAQRIKKGDILILRKGRETICAIGLIVSKYEYLDQFDNVHGWDFQHARRVLWIRREHSFSQSVFGAVPRRVASVNKPEVREYIDKFVRQTHSEWLNGKLPCLPPKVPELELGKIPEGLKGIICRIKRMRDFYYKNGYPTERELVAHCVVPFLRSLGWSEEQIALEWRVERSKVDVCVFSKCPRTPGNCHFLVEAKELDTGLEGEALNQAVKYASQIGVHRVVMTNGMEYYMYQTSTEMDPEEFRTEHFECIGSADLYCLKEGALDLFKHMSCPQ
ncbi:MAG: type I restriction enzyme HsdR N-terminal domain-containing protein [Gammaproteobacteria bacterium]|nr:type I restriction enzyme HsdR N-terminal domain-containing protein [Gammaproteobacteria bacterium]